MGGYPKSPAYRQNRRGKTEPGSDYTCIDLAMREPVRILNEELRLRTYGCCEFHPGDMDRRRYDVFRYIGRPSDFDYRQPYYSYIDIDLDKFQKVERIMRYLKKIGFRNKGEPEKRNEYKNGKEELMMNAYYWLETDFLLGVLGFLYSYHGSKDSLYGRFTITVAPGDKQQIRQWRDWDRIRDLGWEYWLEILHRHYMEGS